MKIIKKLLVLSYNVLHYVMQRFSVGNKNRTNPDLELKNKKALGENEIENFTFYKKLISSELFLLKRNCRPKPFQRKSPMSALTGDLLK